MKMSSTTSNTYSAGPVDSQGNVRCKHGWIAEKKTSRTTTNPDRVFYVCRKSRNDADYCKFWEWEDAIFPHLKDVSTNQVSPPVSQSNQATGNSYPSTLPSQDQTSSTMAPPPSMFTSSRKRQRSASPGGHSIASIPSVKRVAGSYTSPRNSQEKPAVSSIIGGTHQEACPLGSSNNSMSSHLDSSSTQPTSYGHVSDEEWMASPSPDTPRQDQDIGPRVLLASRTASDSSIGPELWSTGVRRPSTPHREGPGGSGNTIAHGILTPPRSTPRTKWHSSAHQIYPQAPATPTRSNGKTRDLLASTASGLQNDQSVPRLSFELQHDAFHHRPTPVDKQQAEAVPGWITSPDSIIAHLDALSCVPEHIRKLERKIKALESSVVQRTKAIDELKADKIRLEERNNSLENRNRVLEDQLSESGW